MNFEVMSALNELEKERELLKKSYWKPYRLQ